MQQRRKEQADRGGDKHASLLRRRRDEPSVSGGPAGMEEWSSDETMKLLADESSVEHRQSRGVKGLGQVFCFCLPECLCGSDLERGKDNVLQRLDDSEPETAPKPEDQPALRLDPLPA